MAGSSPESQSSEREDDITRTLVRLADTVVGAYDEVALLRDLVDSAVRLLDGHSAGISLSTGSRLGFVIATSEAMELIELHQADVQQGPCMDAFLSGTAVGTDDIASDGDRWPTWAPRAIALGFCSAEAFPMRLHDRPIGAMNVYRTTQGRPDVRDRRVGQGLADMATIGLLHHRTAADQRAVQEQLQYALDSRVLIEQAKGVLMERHTLTAQAAFDQLRRYAREHGTRLHDTAALVAAGELDV